MYGTFVLFCCIDTKFVVMLRCRDRGINLWKWWRVSRNMLCSCLEEGVEKQEPVINSDVQLKNDCDVTVKFKY